MNITSPRPTLTSRDFFNGADLSRVCTMPESGFETAYNMTRVACDQDAPSDFYLFRDNGSSILAVAHLDTVGAASERECHIVNTQGGTVVYSRALDDRLGAYVLAELLPSMGLTFDLLLTVGEEDGQSTAAFFDPARHHDRTYDWVIEFDRGGTDVVLYQYEDSDLIEMVEDTGARVEQGIFSDISYMEDLGIKAMNWGVGYRDYHGPRAHVWLDDMFRMVDYFLAFHAEWAGTHLPHTPAPVWGGRRGYSWDWDAAPNVIGAAKPTHSTSTQCIEAEWDEEGCAGAVTKDGYGLLCASHRAWYTD